MSEDKKIKIIFQPGCFDEFEGTQEELDAMMEEIQRMADTGELFEEAHELTLDDLQELSGDDEFYQVVLDKVIEPEERKRRLH